MKIYRNALLILLGFASSAWGRNYDGREVWKERCVKCHTESKAGPVAASYFAGLQWQRFLQNNRHERIAKIELSKEDQELLLTYLKGHAADSDSPEVAGMR